MSTSDNCKDGLSKSNDSVCDNMNDMLQNMSVRDADDKVNVCANCGKEGDDINNICNKCNQVKYCNAVCKKVHKKKHKKDCEEYIKIATEKHGEELRIAAEHEAKLHDEKLFKQPPPKEDCPICFQRLPTLDSGSTYNSCCGKVICNGCVHAPVYDNQGNKVAQKVCPFCRVPYPNSMEKEVQRVKKRIEANDAQAFFNMGCFYRDGVYGLPQDHTKALELFHRAGDLGYANAYNNIGSAYYHGRKVKVDMKKALHYYELGAMGGNEIARDNLGNIEEEINGNIDRALKHHMIAARSGDAGSLERIKVLYGHGHATKEDYTQALRSYQEYLGEIKSPQRDEAAALSDKYRYY